MTEDDVFAGAFEADEPAELAPATPEPAPEPAPEVAPEPAPEPAPTPEPEPAKVEAKEPGYVPLASMLDEREKRQRAEAERDSLRAAQQPKQVPDAYDDPAGFAEHQQAQVAQAIQNQTLNVSERFARKEYGAETVTKAKEWALEKFAADPLYQQRVLNDPDPYEFVVTEWKREQVFTQLQPTELDQFLAWKAAQTAAPAPLAAPAATPTAPVRPPPSLAGAPSAGALSTLVPEDPFDAEFKRKG